VAVLLHAFLTSQWNTCALGQLCWTSKLRVMGLNPNQIRIIIVLAFINTLTDCCCCCCHHICSCYWLSEILYEGKWLIFKFLFFFLSFPGSTAQLKSASSTKSGWISWRLLNNFLFLQGRVLGPTPNPHPAGPGLCIYIPQKQGGYPF
jgi:hypothetical protein